MNKIWIFLITILVTLAFTGVANAAEMNDEYIMNVEMNDEPFISFAKHDESINDGNWISLDGGEKIKLPFPIKFTYNGVNHAEFDVSGQKLGVNLNINNYENYLIEYPFKAHQMYTNTTNENDINFRFNGSNAFANENATIYLINRNTSSIIDILNGIRNQDYSFSELLDVFEKSTIYSETITLDGDGDFYSSNDNTVSNNLTNLDAGHYSILMLSKNEDVDEPAVILSATAFEVLDYDSTVNTQFTDGSLDVGMQLKDAPNVNYTYGSALIKESEYKADVLMEFDGSKNNLDITANGEPVVDNFDLVGLNLSNLNKEDVKDRAVSFVGAENISAQVKLTQYNNTTLNLNTKDFVPGNYILLSGAITDDNNLVAFKQSDIPLDYRFDITVDQKSKSVEQNETAEYYISVTNTGNIKEDINLTKVDVPDVKSSLNKSKISGLMPGETETVKLKVSSTSVGEGNPVIVMASPIGSDNTQVVTTRTSVIDALDVNVDSIAKTTGTATNATYTLTVTNTGNKQHTFNINFDTYSDNINGSLSNKSVTLKDSESQSVVYEVNGTEKGVYATDITVNDSSEPSITESLFVITNVKTKPVYGISLSTDVKKQQIDTGNAIYNITIVNSGNRKDTYNLTVVNPRADNANLNDSAPVTLEAGDKTVRKLTVSPSESGNYNVKVVAVSQNSSKMDKVNTLTKVNGHGVVLTADSYSSAADPGDIVNYTVTLKNTGDVTDNFSLTKKTNADYIDMPSEIKNVAPNEKESFDIALSNSNTGNYNATITATSNTDSNANNSVELDLNVESEPNYDVSLTADSRSETIEKNENVTYLLTIKNTGNVKDSYEISSKFDDAEFDTKQVTLKAGESTSITMIVSGLDDINTYSIPVTVESSNSGVEKDKTVYAEVIGAVDIKATPSTQTKNDNNASDYVIEVTNTGTKTHSYDLSVTNKPGTTANLATGTIPDLSPGESTTVDFSFNKTQDDSRRIEASIKAEVQDEPEKSAVTSVSTLYIEENVYGVSVETDTKQQSIGSGKNAQYFLTVKNLGNTNETFNLTTVEGTNVNLEKETVDLNASGTDGSSVVIPLNHLPNGVGEHTAEIDVSSDNATDTVEITTRVVAPPKNSEIINSVIGGRSAVIDSYIDPSTVENSLISKTDVIDSTIKNSKFVNSTVIDSNLNNIDLKDGYIEDNKVYNGTLVVDGTEYIIDDSEDPIDISNLITGVDNLDSSISGLAGSHTKVTADNSDVELTFNNNEDYVGGTLDIQRANIPSKGIDKFSDNVGGYVKIEESENINNSTGSVELNFSYDDTGNIDESNLDIYWFDEDNNKWIPMDGTPHPERDYVTATVDHFSTYTIGPVANTDTDDDTDEDTSGGDSGGVNGGSTVSGEPSENIADKFVQMKYLNINKSVNYEFDGENNPVNSVKFTPLVNAGYVNVVVEMLEDTSTFVDEKPEGNIYKNMNIFIGKDNWANEDTLTNPTISFSVDKSWLSSNDIDAENVALLRYDDSWDKLLTTKTDEDADKVYYTAETPGYSPFVIIGTTVSGDEVGGPTADFTASTTSGTTPLDVEFTDQSENVNSWEWELGDGTSSAEQNPTHTYEEPGNYTVTLTVSNEDGETATETSEITVNEESEESQPEEGIPGFEAMFAVAGLLAVAYLVRRVK